MHVIIDCLQVGVLSKEVLAAKKALEAAEYSEKRWTIIKDVTKAGYRVICKSIKEQMEQSTLDVRSVMILNMYLTTDE